MNQSFSADSQLEGGFTLIELLVVIAIISLLSSVVLSSLQDARAGARDARRQLDLRHIQQGLEMYYTDNGEYPDCDQFLDNPTSGCLQNALISNGYMEKLPVDPRFGDDGTAAWGYDYEYDVRNSSNQQDYVLRVALEGTMKRTHDYPNSSTCQTAEHPKCNWFENRCVYVSDHAVYGPSCGAYWLHLGGGG